MATKIERWRYHFYMVTGEIPKGETVEECWSQLGRHGLTRAIRFLGGYGLAHAICLHYGSKHTHRHGAPLPLPPYKIRAVLPIPSETDFAVAAAHARRGYITRFGSPWELTPYALDLEYQAAIQDVMRNRKRRARALSKRRAKR